MSFTAEEFIALQTDMTDYAVEESRTLGKAGQDYFKVG